MATKSLATQPSVLLAQVVQWIEANDIIRLSMTTPAILARFKSENIVTEVKIESAHFRPSCMTHLAPHMSSFRLDGALFANSRIACLGPRLISSLPSSLVHLELIEEFGSLLVRPAPLDGVDWFGIECDLEYAPVYLSSLFPNLKSLRLNPRSKEDGLSFRPIHPSQVDTPLRFPFGKKNVAPDAHVGLSVLAQALLMKHLPQDLTLLEIPFHDALARCLPPRLTHLENTRTSSELTSVDIRSLPASLRNTLEVLTIALVTPLDPALVSFQCLHTLHLHSRLTDKDLAHLPSSLATLDIEYDGPWSAIVRLPRFITTLGLSHCPSPSYDLRVDRTTGAPWDPPIGSRNPDPIDFWPLLPAQIRNFSLRKLSSNWSQEHFTGLLEAPLPLLTSLGITSEQYISMDSLEWVPCDRLKTLELEWNVNGDTHPPPLDSWPNGRPNNITSLKWGLTIDYGDGSTGNCYFSDGMVPLLPPSLTSLTCAVGYETTTPTGFLSTCPRSLTSLDLGERCDWNFEETQSVVRSGMAPPNLTHIRVNFEERKCNFDTTETDIGMDTYKRWTKQNSFLKNSPPIYCLFGADFRPTSALTSIYIHATIDKNWKIWEIPTLTRLEAGSITGIPDSSPAHLKSLLCLKSFDLQCLKAPACRSLEDLCFTPQHDAWQNASLFTSDLLPHLSRLDSWEGRPRIILHSTANCPR